jgi:glutamate--cysteine ligase
MALVSNDDEARFLGLVDGQPITESQAEGWIPRTCFKHGPPGRIGIELEFLVHRDPGPDASGPGQHLGTAQLQRLFDDLDDQPLHSRFTVEPGGQVELSSPPADSVSELIPLLERDLAVLSGTLSRHGARLVGSGIDPLPPPPRHLRGARYAAMETYFDRWGTAGRAMMRSSASVQVNVEAGRLGRGPEDLRRRWDLLHAIGPALVAVFANSPSYPAADPGWAGFSNLRQGVWLTLDPDRCRAPQILPTESLPDAWTRWVLDAPVMAVRHPDRAWTVPDGLSFRQWLRDGADAVPGAPAPTLSDLRYHLTTLFPPVRARGHLEVRYLDAQPGRWWRVPAAVISALLDDDVATDAALAASEPVADRWLEAARTGLADPELEKAARRLLTEASAALDRDGRPELAELTAEYLDRTLDRQLDRTGDRNGIDPDPTLNALEARPC